MGPVKPVAGSAVGTRYPPRLTVCETLEEIGARAASIVAGCVRGRRKVNLGLATGRTPLPLYANLVALFEKGVVSFRQVSAFALDEYCGSVGSGSESFSAYIRTHFSGKVDIPPGNVHLPSCQPGVTEKYDSIIRDAGGIDLQVLGIGSNGHIGFNEPGSAFDSRTRVVELHQSTVRENWNGARFTPIGNPAPTHAATMGIRTILEARSIVLLASGSNKANAIERAFSVEPDTRCPASALQFHPDVHILLDAGASGEMSEGAARAPDH